MESDLIFGLICSLALIGILIFFILFYANLYRKKQKYYKKEHDQFNETILKTEIEIRETTLNNVSRELHDNLGQLVALLNINLSLIQPKEANDAKKIEDSKIIVKQLISDIKTIATNLKSENTTRVGLSQLIENDLNKFRKLTDIEVEIIGLENMPLINNDRSSFLYRIYQEIVSNILKHAQANKITLSFSTTGNKHRLSIADNGIGFLPSERQKTGNGLDNINERCNFIGAEMELNSVPNKGTEVIIIF